MSTPLNVSVTLGSTRVSTQINSNVTVITGGGLSNNNYVLKTESGQFYSIYNPNNYCISGNLYATGQYLLNQINILSGATGNILDSTVVRTTGNQIISGNKTFTGQMFVPYIYGKNLIGLSSNALINLDAGEITDNILNTTSIQWFDRHLHDAGAIESLDWNNRILSGHWKTNTVPTLSGHLTNKYYFDQQTGNLYPNYNPNNYATSGVYGGSGAAPSTNNLTIPASISVYGTNNILMGNPAGWLDIIVSGQLKKIPFY